MKSQQTLSGYLPYSFFSSVSSWTFPKSIWNNSDPQYVEDIRLAPNKTDLEHMRIFSTRSKLFKAYKDYFNNPPNQHETSKIGVPLYLPQNFVDTHL